jgi:hypothetical protein
MMGKRASRGSPDRGPAVGRPRTVSTGTEKMEEGRREHDNKRGSRRKIVRRNRHTQHS